MTRLPAYAWLGRRPFLTIYGDGRVFTVRESRAYSGAPVGMATGLVDKATLQSLITSAQRSGLFDDADFGDPQVTDLGTLLTHTRAEVRCGVLSGATARRVYRAARDNGSVYWTVDGKVRALVVRALLPGERGCRGW